MSRLTTENDGRKYNLDTLLCLLLAVITLVVYWQIQYHDFINYDDYSYVLNNNVVKNGLSWDGILWAFKDVSTGYWHPLTWLSHMLDWQLFKSNPAGHHWTSLIFHIVNVLLLYSVFKKMTGDSYKSCFVAALFAVHPINVESVAWIAERKNVLSTTFWMLTVLAYIYYVNSPSFLRYLPVFLFYLAGLMFKPMLVTLPFVLLLIDYWPLRRMSFAFSAPSSLPDINKHSSDKVKNCPHLILEKIPLFFLSIAVSILTYISAISHNTVASWESLSFSKRIGNALISYVLYMKMMLWPDDLAILYPYPTTIPLLKSAAAGILLVIITVTVLKLLKKFPFLAVGWFWYLGVLFPAIGLIQAGAQSMADRYAYLSFIGLFIVLTWGISEITEHLKHKKLVLSLSAIIIVFILMIVTINQVSLWRNSFSLFEHCLNVTTRNYIIHSNLGGAFLNTVPISDSAVNSTKNSNGVNINNPDISSLQKNNLDKAMYHFLRALKYNPDFADARNNLGVALARQGQLDNAISNFRKALLSRSDYVDAYNNLGSALARQGNLDEAILTFKKSLQIKNDDFMVHNNVGMALFNKERLCEAKGHFLEALKIEPSNREVQYNLYRVNNIISGRCYY
jgi:protein O-mannosyl-transferase